MRKSGWSIAEFCMKIKTATFLTAAEDSKSYPPGGLKEIAFAGRSNVGKSSMINCLLGRHNLVKTSRTPGHTRKLNFFLINDSLIFVDLPGYGFARVPIAIKNKWGPMVDMYMQNRQELSAVVVIIDARLSLLDVDARMMDCVRECHVPLIVVATKADKLTHSQRLEVGRSMGRMLSDRSPVVIFSSHSGLGKNELWKEIKNLIE
jgi:GTP-binding protein